MQIIDGILARTELTMNANGGSELMMTRLYNSLPKEVFQGYQIINSRIDQYAGIREDLHRILILHDLPNDPASAHLNNDGHRNFHKLVFVSNWQMQQYISAFGIPWSKCLVMKNSIVPIEEHEKPKDSITLGYWTTPHRGLEILVPVYQRLKQKHPNLKLEIYSSFNVYGWKNRDADFQGLFDLARALPDCNVNETLPNDQLREKLKDIHILAYPSIWPETSCMTLMEAMSAKCLAVHSNYAALYETSSGYTHMYQLQDRMADHAEVFMNTLDIAIENYNHPDTENRLISAKSYADYIYNHEHRMKEWLALLSSNIIKSMPLEPEKEFITIKGS